jgi:drug/metabolite transporter (DMT)-like permease
MSYSLYNIVTRILSRHDSSETTLFYSNLVGFLATLPVLPFVWSKPTSIFIIVLMVVVGAFGSIGHYLLIAGHRLAPASVLAPFIYTQLVWVAIFGYFVFAQIPDGWTVVGASIVVGSGLYILYRERSMLRVK